MLGSHSAHAERSPGVKELGGGASSFILWCYGVYDKTACAHNEVTLISFCKDHLKAVTVPFEDKLLQVHLHLAIRYLDI